MRSSSHLRHLADLASTPAPGILTQSTAMLGGSVPVGGGTHGPGNSQPNGLWQRLSHNPLISGIVGAGIGAAATIGTAVFADAQGAITININNDGSPASSSLAGHSPPAASSSGTPDSSASPRTEASGAGPFELLFSNNGVDLDSDPPNVGLGPDPNIDIYDGGGSIVSYPIWPGVAAWTKPNAPSRNDCIALLRSFPTMSSTYVKGSQYCVHTRDERHVAFVEFVEPVTDGWKIRVTVWQGTAG
jgi:hypothetical protein